MACLALKGLMDDNNVACSNRQIQQAYTLKSKMETHGFQRNNATIASIDVEKMYPSMRFSLLSSAVQYFARNFSREDKETANLCLPVGRVNVR